MSTEENEVLSNILENQRIIKDTAEENGPDKSEEENGFQPEDDINEPAVEAMEKSSEIPAEEPKEVFENNSIQEDNRTDKQEKKKENSDVWRSVFDFLEIFAYAFAVVLIVMTFFVRHSPVSGTSMYPTLDDGDLLILTPIYDEIDNGDIVVFQSENIGFDEPLVKRVIATGGQTIDIDFTTWTVTVDGVALDEDYINNEFPAEMRNYLNHFDYPVTVPEGCLFCMGDNRNGSWDSRDSYYIGFVDERTVIGKVILRLYPFDKICSF